MAAGITYVVVVIATIPQVVKDCYGQWATGDLVIDYHRKNGRWPTSWDDLATVRDVNPKEKPHNGGMTFEQVRERMLIDFNRLPELEFWQDTPRASFPEIIQTKSGRQSHWSGAEPNRMIHEYFRERGRKHADG